MALPIILADNRFRDATPTATDTATGYDVAAIADERTYTFWQAAAAGIKYLTVNCGSSKAANAVAVIGHNLYTAGVALSVEYSSNGSDWSEALAGATPTTDGAFLRTFTEQTAQYWRVKLASGSAAPRVAQIVLGQRITVPWPPDGPYTPYTETVEAETTLGKTGHILGSLVHFKPLAIAPRWREIDRTWTFGTFQAFWDGHASLLRPFFWAWDLEVFPAHVFYVALAQRGKWATPLSRLAVVDSLALDLIGVRE